MNKIVIIDGHALAYRLIHSIAGSKDLDTNIDMFQYWNYLMVYNLFSLIEKFNPNKVIIAFDSSNSWRYDYYDNYKQNRKNKDKLKFDYKIFKENLDKFIEILTTVFTKYFVVRVDRAEGDDIIAVLTKHLYETSEIVIISSDSDYIQLLNSNVKIYDPRSKKYLTSLNPKTDLNIKILKGDASDRIPPIKRLIGIVHATKIITSGLDNYLPSLPESEQAEVLKNYDRNKILINFDFIPKDLQNKILENYQTYNIKPVDGKQLVNFLIKNKMSKLLPTLKLHTERMDKLS